MSRWNESISMLLDQGYPPSTINIAIPYCAPPLAPDAASSADRAAWLCACTDTPSGAAWADLCHECPDLAPDNNSCAGDPIVGAPTVCPCCRQGRGRTARLCRG